MADFNELIGDPQSLHFLTALNLAGLYGVFLSLVGAVLVVFLLLAYLAAHFTRTMDTRTNESFLIVIGLLVPWLVLQAYSEWYDRFGEVRLFVEYSPFVPALLISAVAIFFCYLSRQQTRRPVLIAVGIMAVIPGLASLLGTIRPTFSSKVAEVFYTAPMSTKFTVYATFVITVLGAGFSLVPQPGTKRKRSGRDPLGSRGRAR